jgi:carbamoyl-phosphate synthase large subunit
MSYTRPLRIMVTGAGAPGAWGILRALRKGAHQDNKRPVCVIGVDMRQDASGFTLCDRSQVIPPASHPDFLERLRALCEREQIDVVIPLVTRELGLLADARERFEALGTKVIVSDPDVIALVNDKHRAIEAAKQAGLAVPDTRIARTVTELNEAATDLGYPDVAVIVKPCISNGSRGMRLLDPSADRLRILLDEKPSALPTTLEDISAVLATADPMPPFLVMEYLPGDEYSVDCLADGKSCLVALPRRRDRIRSGITLDGTLEEDAVLIDQSRRLTELYKPFGAVGYQFKRDVHGTAKLIEVNPRLQGTTALSVASGVNVPWLSACIALGELVEIGPIAWGTRIVRYWGDTFRAPDGRLMSIDGT